MPAMNPFLRIAIVAACPFPYSRGTPIRVFKMAETLSKRGHDVHVVTYHLGAEIDAVPFTIHRIPNLKTYQKCTPGPTYQKLLLLDPLLVLKLIQILRKQPIDVIYAHHYEGLLVSAVVQKLTKHPIIYDAHTMLQSELPFYGLGLSKKVKLWLGNCLDGYLPKLADHIISVSSDIEQKLVQENGFASENITTIPNGVEYYHFNGKSTQRVSPQSERKSLIFTGNLAAYQGVDLMLQAFSQVVNQHQEVELQIISNDAFDTYEALAGNLQIRDHIKLIPSDFRALPQHLATADIALNPRINCDGTPLKLLNYMAAGKAIVSFVSSAKTVEHEKTALVVEDGNVDAFAQAICRLLTDPTLSNQLGINAKEKVKTEHLWENVGQKAEEVLSSVYTKSQRDRPQQKSLKQQHPLSKIVQKIFATNQTRG